MTVTAAPTTAGFIIDSVVVISGDFIFTASTNLVTQVTNAVAVPQADLAVAITVPASAVFTNDWMVYGVSVTNLGPGTAPGVFLTNTLPPAWDTKVSRLRTKLHGSAFRAATYFQPGHADQRRFHKFPIDGPAHQCGPLTFLSVVSTNNVCSIPIRPTTRPATISPFCSYFPGQLSGHQFFHAEIRPAKRIGGTIHPVVKYRHECRCLPPGSS